MVSGVLFGSQALDASREPPFPQAVARLPGREGFQFAGILAGVRRSLEEEDSLADLLIVSEVGPVGREPDDDPTRRFVNQRRHLDEPRPPRAWLTLAQWILRASPVVVLPATSTSERGRRTLHRPRRAARTPPADWSPPRVDWHLVNSTRT